MKNPIALLLLLAVCGCSEEKPAAPAADALAESYWRAAPPDGAVEVLAARAMDPVPETVVVRGRVGEFVDARAQFKLVDDSLPSCDRNPADSCRTPWDYCCIAPNEVAAATIVVEIREDGRLAKAGLRGFHGFDHLALVTVVGQLEEDEAGNRTLVASGMHVAAGGG